MKRKHWTIFAVVEMIGATAVVDAAFLQDPLLLGVAVLFLLPGSLASVALYAHGYVGDNWSFWKLGAVALLANVFLFSVAYGLVTRLRRPK